MFLNPLVLLAVLAVGLGVSLVLICLARLWPRVWGWLHVPAAEAARLRQEAVTAKVELKDRLGLRKDLLQVETAGRGMVLQSVVTLVQSVGVLVLVAGLVGTCANLQVAQRNVQLAQEGQITDRFTKAIEQLGSERNGTPNLEVRLGGIYALERIAADSARDHWPVMEVLAAYLRQNARWEGEASTLDHPDPAAPPAGGAARVAPLRTDIHAAVTALRRRDAAGTAETGRRLDLRQTDLRGADLGGARLREVDLTGARLDGAIFRGAQLQEANFTGAQLLAADFTDADLRGTSLVEARLDRAQFGRARLERATLQRARLRNASFGRANLDQAVLEGAQLQGAQLDGATLRRANLIWADLKGASLRQANLEGAFLQYARLDEAWLHGARLTGAQFEGTYLNGALLVRVIGLTDEQRGNIITDHETHVSVAPALAPSPTARPSLG